MDNYLYKDNYGVERIVCPTSIPDYLGFLQVITIHNDKTITLKVHRTSLIPMRAQKEKPQETKPQHPDVFKDIGDFHRKFGIQYDGPPRDLPQVVKMARIARTNEEFSEMLAGYAQEDLEKVLDANIDLIYFALGNIYLHGFDFDEAWRRVHAANMAKERASTQNPGKHIGHEHFCDIVKPAGWVAPTLADLVK